MSTWNLPPGVTTADIERAQGLEEVSDLCPHDRPWNVECAKCEEDDRLHDPDHLNPDKGGNRAGDDYW